MPSHVQFGKCHFKGCFWVIKDIKVALCPPSYDERVGASFFADLAKECDRGVSDAYSRLINTFLANLATIKVVEQLICQRPECKMVPGLDVFLPKEVSNLIGIFHLWRDAESCWTREGGHASHIKAFVDEETLV